MHFFKADFSTSELSVVLLYNLFATLVYCLVLLKFVVLYCVYFHI